MMKNLVVGLIYPSSFPSLCLKLLPDHSLLKALFQTQRSRCFPDQNKLSTHQLISSHLPPPNLCLPVRKWEDWLWRLTLFKEVTWGLGLKTRPSTVLTSDNNTNFLFCLSCLLPLVRQLSKVKNLQEVGRIHCFKFQNLGMSKKNIAKIANNRLKKICTKHNSVNILEFIQIDWKKKDNIKRHKN